MGDIERDDALADAAKWRERAHEEFNRASAALLRAQNAEVEVESLRSQLRGAVEEARAALRWIASNAVDDEHGPARLRQIKTRADEALDDLGGRYDRDALPSLQVSKENPDA